ncbi:hypothetical protein CKM354_000499700 [Cercospora kikuchii]|uniref:Uncharacterized protein n=1 Tax=Cercospora kikuchii TaxID=84275 RepID=A0A9P3FBW5_9PEZI|nr:uncharacterized protein CKM354_000499700 [Cercospora kikuchii]GIZ41701.1 hypothetical protein CKM354_000499700 [Cercospora kikuchii]
MSNEPPGASCALRELLQTLPQELYNNIYDEVFTAVPSDIVVRKYSYNWPHLLHVDRASREAYAKSYFGLTTFFCHGDFELRWVRTLCDEHFEFTKGLFLLCGSDDDESWMRFLMYMELRDTMHLWGKDKADKVQVISHSEKLPEELYNSIYDDVFTAMPGTLIVRDKSSTWPHLLHVDRASREMYARSYFAVTTIVICDDRFGYHWLRALSHYHIDLVKKIFCLCPAIESPGFWHTDHLSMQPMLQRTYGKKKAEKMRFIGPSEAKKWFGI